jgi:hypothetical protein
VYRARDVEIYEQAKQRFQMQCRKYGVAVAA